MMRKLDGCTGQRIIILTEKKIVKITGSFKRITKNIKKQK